MTTSGLGAAMTLAEALLEARRQFAAAGLSDAAFEARLLLGGLLGLSSTEVFTGGDRPLMPEESARIADAIARRLKREPVHRILGRREFYGLDLGLSAETLEPRPDTEVLVEAMLEPLRRIVARKGAASIVDLGTGTGAILLALLSEVPEAVGLAVDMSDDALATAADNARRLGVETRFRTLKSDWFSEISGVFDIIVSNPPYIRTSVIADLDPEVRNFDPAAALDGGPDGLDAYRAIARDAGSHLAPGGWIGLEIGYDQQESVTTIFRNAGFIFTQARRDYGDNDRVLVFEGSAT